jgi:hypothetical protein
VRRVAFAGVLVLWATAAAAQVFTERGFVEGTYYGYPQTTPIDTTRNVGDVLVREEVFLKPSEWFQVAAGVDYRANSHDQVEDEWRLDFSDRGVLQPRFAVRRLTATFTARRVTVDVGKQFIRWARADILNPADRFAPRDYLNVIDTEFLPVLGVRASVQAGAESFEGVWVPRLTPSRVPLFDQRWSVLSPTIAGTVTIDDRGSVIPEGSQQGFRWSHAGRFEASLSYFNGFNHLPNIEPQVLPATLVITRTYPELRTFGGDLAVPGSWFTVKGEAAYFSSPDSSNEEYLLYVIEIERQVGEWSLNGGYAGEEVTHEMPAFRFAPDRGVARTIIGRAAYTVDPRRTVAIEAAVRRNLDGFYVKGEYSQAWGQHWRMTATGVGIGGDPADFLGQYDRNSYGSFALRFSF